MHAISGYPGDNGYWEEPEESVYTPQGLDEEFYVTELPSCCCREAQRIEYEGDPTSFECPDCGAVWFPA